MIYVYWSLSFLIGFASGYGVRALVSRRRRAAMRREREWRGGPLVPPVAEENRQSPASKVVSLTSEGNLGIQASQDGLQRRGSRPEGG